MEKNALIIYKAIRQVFIDNDYTDNWFWEDHFKNNDPSYFIDELKRNETWLDLNKKPTIDDIERIMDNIEEGMTISSAITRMVGNITDAKIGDGLINY